MKKKLIAVILSVLLAGCMAGCGRTELDESANSAGGETPSNQTAGDAGQPSDAWRIVRAERGNRFSSGTVRRGE